MSIISSFTQHLIDYAGLFPPAGKDMPTVVADYARYLAGPNQAKLARLIVPATRLAEFESAAENVLPTNKAGQPWKISALVPAIEKNKSEFGFAISGISQFNGRHAIAKNGLAVVDVIEIKTPTAGHIERTMEEVPVTLKAFMEIPYAEDPGNLIQLVSTGGARRFFAKIRTGGVTPDLIPATKEVARFIHACAENLVGFKATAGLHHPLRNDFKLTYEPDAPIGTMHGFVNVFAAACFAFAHSISPSEIDSILKIDSVSDISLDGDSLVWNGLSISPAKVARLREEFAVSFGSCSFEEPTAELVDLGLETDVSGLESAV